MGLQKQTDTEETYTFITSGLERWWEKEVVGTSGFILAAFGGLMLLILTVWVVLAGNWVVSGTGVVFHSYDGEWRFTRRQQPLYKF